MVRKLSTLGTLAILIAAGAAEAQPRITSLGQPVTPAGVNNGGTRVVASTNCGNKSFELATSTVSLVDVSVGTGTPAPTFGAFALSADGSTAYGAVAYPGGVTGITTTGNTVGGAWDQATNTWTAMPALPADLATNVKSMGSSGNSSPLTTIRGMSMNGRYMVGQGYVYANTAATGWGVSGSVFVYRPFIWDRQTNTVSLLPTPQYVNSSGVLVANRYKDGRGLGVSNDGSVVVGGFNPNSAGGSSGGSIAVWYRQLDGSYAAEPAGQLPVGSGDASRTVDSFLMTSDGLTIVGTSFDNTDINGNPIPGSFNTHTFLAKWTRPDAASRTWTRTKLYDYSTSQTSATPGSISSWWQAYDCQAGTGNPPAYPDPNFLVGGISDDGNTIVGDLVYSTCGSFVRGGFIYKVGTGPGTGMFDLYDYLVSLNTVDIANYGMVGTLANHFGASLGYPRGISADGNYLVGYGGPFTPLGAAWVVDLTGSSSPKAPFTVCSPSNITGFTHCSSPAVQFGYAAGGSGTLTYAWYKGTPGSGTQLFDGVQASPAASGIGSEVASSSTFLMRVNYPNLADAGSYYCVVSSSNGGSVTSAAATATAATGTQISNDLCASAQDIFLGANAADTTQEKVYDACWAMIDEYRTGSSCYTGNSVSDAWFKFTPASAGDIRIENCASTYFSSVISIFDQCGGNMLACSSTGNSSSTQPTLPSCSKIRINRFSITPEMVGIPLYIRVSTQGSPSTGFSTGKVRMYPAPAVPTNDACASAFTAAIGANAFDTSESTYDSNDIFGGAGPSCSTALSRDVWFQFTPTVRGTLKGSTCHNLANLEAPLTTPNTVLTAYSACGGTEVSGACNDNSNRGNCGATTGTLTTAVNTSLVTVGTVQAGQTTWFRVGGNSATSTSAIGPGTFTILFSPIKCNPADVAGLGGVPGFDGQLTADDIVYYLAQFFANNVAVADIVGLGGAPNPPEGAVTVDDLVYFLNQFFLPCQ